MENQGDNCLLVALSCLERVKAMLHAESRAQLERSTMLSLKQAIMQVLENIVKSDFDDDLVVGPMVAVSDLISDVLDNESIVQTDGETKALISQKLLDGLETFYLKVGQYYEEHDFVYSRRLDQLLHRIVDRCLENGYYFGLDKEIKEERL